MKTWHGSIQIKTDRYKALYEYTCVKANSLEEAIEIAKEKCIHRHIKPIEIINLELREMEN